MCRHRLCLVFALLGVALLTDAGPSQTAGKDQSGDPLPDGALARVGTTRWRHGGVVILASMLPDGQTVVTVSADRTVRLWEFPSGKELRRLAQPEPGPVADFGFRPGFGNV